MRDLIDRADYRVVRFECEHLTLHEIGVYITFGARKVAMTPETVTVDDYAGHQYVFRKDEDYSTVCGGPQTPLRGRNFGIVDRNGDDGPIWFAERSIAA